MRARISDRRASSGAPRWAACRARASSASARVQEVPAAPLDRRDLALQARGLGLHRGLLRAQRRGLALQVGLPGPRGAACCCSSSACWAFSACGLLLERGLLRLALLLLLLELGLEGVGLVLLRLHRRVGRRGRVRG